MEIDLKILANKGLRPDEYVYLYSVLHRDNLYVSVEVEVSLDDLVERDFIEIVEDGVKLKRKAKTILGVYKAEHTKQIQKEADGCNSWIEDYRELFPSKNIGGRALKGTFRHCVIKMKKFIQELSSKEVVMTKDIIMNATKLYLNSQAKDRYMYSKAADHFIWKGSPQTESYLYQYVEMYLEDPSVNIYSGGMTDDI